MLDSHHFPLQIYSILLYLTVQLWRIYHTDLVSRLLCLLASSWVWPMGISTRRSEVRGRRRSRSLFSYSVLAWSWTTATGPLCLRSQLLLSNTLPQNHSFLCVLAPSLSSRPFRLLSSNDFWMFSVYLMLVCFRSSHILLHGSFTQIFWFR